MLQMVKLGRILDHFGSKAVQMCQMINSSPIFCKWTLSFLLLGLLTAFVVRFHSETTSHSAKLLTRWPLIYTTGQHFHSEQPRNYPNSPLAPWPWRRRRRRARAQRAPARARAKRASVRQRAREAGSPSGSPAPQGPTQGVSICTALAKHRSEYMRSVFIRSNLTRVGGCRGA